MKFQTKSVYGRNLIYPIDNIKEIECLTGSKTIGLEQLYSLQKIGVEVELNDGFGFKPLFEIDRVWAWRVVVIVFVVSVIIPTLTIINLIK